MTRLYQGALVVLLFAVASGCSSGGGGSGGGYGAGGTGAGATGGSGNAATGGGGTGGGTVTSGVGTPCDGDTDCPTGQYCRYDGSDYIAHNQCTVNCDSTEECEAAFGQNYKCIGAHICVLECLTDADCPELTQCGDYNWCIRGGPGSGVPYCTGIPTPCFGMSESECISVWGCNYDGGCSGVASSCYSQYSSYSCSSQDGCYWSSSSSSCSGSARSCSLYSSQYSCTSQDGCYWDGSCNGVPDPCEDQYPSLCENQPGCYLEY